MVAMETKEASGEGNGGRATEREKIMGDDKAHALRDRLFCDFELALQSDNDFIVLLM